MELIAKAVLSDLGGGAMEGRYSLFSSSFFLFSYFCLL